MDFAERKSLRLKEYDYGENGAYFVTVCSKEKRHIFGSLVGAGHPAGPHTQLSDIGKIVDKNIRAISENYPDVFVDAYAVMPNHIHIVLRIDKPYSRAGQCPAPTVTLPKVMSALKSLCSRESGKALWQRGYYEHVCRNYPDYIACCRYVLDNPAKWAEDEYYKPTKP